VAVADAQRNVRRMSDLQTKKLVSVSDLETAQTALDSAKAGLDGTKAQLESTKGKQASIKAQIEASLAQLDGSKAQIRQMEAQLSISKINLARTRIFSPITAWSSTAMSMWGRRWPPVCRPGSFNDATTSRK
jgi:membrane fusion protein (multidrug efflux system)